jgi:hypothetical protein
MAFNLIASLAGHQALRKLLDSARSEFGTVRLVPVLDPDEDFSPTALRNVVVIAERGG